MVRKVSAIIGSILVVAVGVAVLMPLSNDSSTNNLKLEMSPELSSADPLRSIRSDSLLRTDDEARLQIPQQHSRRLPDTDIAAALVGGAAETGEAQASSADSSFLSDLLSLAEGDTTPASEASPSEQLASGPSITVNSPPVKQSDDNLISGARGDPGSQSDGVAPPPNPTPIPSASASPTPTPLPFVSGQARGYMTLYLMQPEARQTVERELQTLLDARVRDVYLGVLTDGTFGKNFEYLQNVLRRLHAAGRRIVLALYLSNGATMRTENPIAAEAGFNDINPLIFRELIRFDEPIRRKFLGMVNEVKPTFDLNRSLSPQNRNIAVVMLEDNLDSESYYAMRSLAKSVLGTSVEYMRNPCPSCGVEGSDFYAYGDNLEFHKPEGLHALSDGDGFTTDGESFRFPDEPPGVGLSLDEVRLFMEESLAQGLDYFGIWRQQRQGIYADGVRLEPNERRYEVPTAAQIAEEIKLLRHGLTVELGTDNGG